MIQEVNWLSWRSWGTRLDSQLYSLRVSKCPWARTQTQTCVSMCVWDCETPACTLLLRCKAWWQHKVVRIPDVQRFLKFLYWPKLTKVFWTIACLQTVSEHCRNGKKNAVLYCCWLLAAQKNVCSDMQCWRLNLDYVTPVTATGVCSARRGHKVTAFCGPFQACEKSNKEQKRVECLLTLYKYNRSKVL